LPYKSKRIDTNATGHLSINDSVIEPKVDTSKANGFTDYSLLSLEPSKYLIGLDAIPIEL